MKREGDASTASTPSVNSAATSPLPPFAWGQVRASPTGSCLSTPPLQSASNNNNNDINEAQAQAQAFHQWRKDNLQPIEFPAAGFDHIYGQPVIDQVDEHPLGMITKHEESQSDKEASEKQSSKATKVSSSTQQPFTPLLHVHEYGSTKSPDDAPVGSLKSKWRLLPYFIKLRSLLRQHIDSFDHFVNVEMQQIVQSPSACEIRSDHDPRFYLRYEACWVGEPSVEEDSYASQAATPFQCRLRDCTYSAPIYVNVRFTRGRQIVVKRNVVIGRMPIMLRSQKCMLRDQTEDQLAAMKECPYDPGGYFIIKGVEKVILIQEQLSKNRVILEQSDGSGSSSIVTASITSSTHERKSKAYILIKHGRVYLKNNTLGEDIPIVIVLKAMGIESDVELVHIVGSEPELLHALALSLEEPFRYQIFTQMQVCTNGPLCYNYYNSYYCAQSHSSLSLHLMA
jgi:hypothetical protein